MAAARGHQPFDLLLCNGTVVDVGTGELRSGDVEDVRADDRKCAPAGFQQGAASEIVDCAGRIVAPGLIDMHVHFESSMLTPGPYAEAVCPRGTTTIFCDPHELANVAGVAGMRYAVDASRGLPVRFIVQAPSCVPPQPGLELSGHDLMGAEIAQMLSWPEVGGLAEVMDMLGVLGDDRRMHEVVAAGLASGKLVSGHAAGLTGSDLQAYLASGIDSDHEIFMPGDVLARLQRRARRRPRGMIDPLLPQVVADLAALPELPTHIVACTDDLFALTLLTEGGVDHLLRRLISYGMPAVRALRLATYNAAYRLGDADLGLVAASQQAPTSSSSPISKPSRWTTSTPPVSMFAHDGKMRVPCDEGPAVPPLHTVHVACLTPDDFVVHVALPRRCPRAGRGHANPRHRRGHQHPVGRSRGRGCSRRGPGATRSHHPGSRAPSWSYPCTPPHWRTGGETNGPVPSRPRSRTTPTTWSYSVGTRSPWPPLPTRCSQPREASRSLRAHR